MEELKPCPFCGEPGHVVPRFKEQVWQVFCAECDCELESHYESKDKAIAAWNIRASQWRDIETAPRDGTFILMGWGNANDTPVIVFWNGHHWDDGDFNSRLDGGDFWQPLPQPPVSK